MKENSTIIKVRITVRVLEHCDHGVHPIRDFQHHE
jgi:hypothetical protein